MKQIRIEDERKLRLFHGIAFKIIGILSLSTLAFHGHAADTLSIVQCGAVGDGKTVNTEAIQLCIDKASKSKSVVKIPSGTFVSGALVLDDNTTLFLAKGATLLGSPKLKDYPKYELTTTRSYTERYTKKAFIYAEAKKNITIAGEGIIDGNGDCEEFASVKDISVKPLGIKLVTCKNVTIENLKIQNAGLWLQHYLNCEKLTIRNITGFNHGHFTNDGLDIDGCRNVLVEGIDMDSHDDALVFKSTGPAKCENIKVRNCYLRSHCHALKFGTETTGGFKNIDISNIKITSSKELHAKQKKKWPVNSGVAIEITDGGVMENVKITNLTADSVYGPIFIKLGNRQRKHRDDAPEPPMGKMKNIHLENIKITNALMYSSQITGVPGYYIENVSLKNIDIQYAEAAPADAIFETVPETNNTYPEITMFSRGLDKRYYLPTYGLFARHVKNLTIENFNVTKAEGETRKEFIFEDVINNKLIK